MKIKFKLSIMMIAIVVAIAGGIAVIQLQRASGMAETLAKEKLAYLTRVRAMYWEGRLDGYMKTLHTMADVFSYFENITPEDRRSQYGEVMRSVFEEQPDFVRMFTVWKPNALDGMDSRYIGRPGTTETGQVAFALTRENGRTEVITALVVQEVMEHISGPNALKDSVSHPAPVKVAGKDSFIIRFIVPVINSRTGEVVGSVGCQLNVDLIQPLVEETIRTHEEIAIQAMYSSNGFVLASFLPERVGKMMVDVDKHYGKYINAVFEAIKTGNEYQCFNFAPAVNTNVQMAIAPINIGNSDTKWAVMIGSDEAYIMKEVNQMIRFTVILSLIALPAAVVLIYWVLKRVTKPIVTVAATLRDISEGEGDLTKTIETNAGAKDEISDLSRYFNLTLGKIKNLIISIKKEASALSDIGNDLSGNMTETAAAVNQITANIQSIKGRVINQSTSVFQTNATMDQVIANINKLGDHVESQSDSVSQASSALEEMVANINSVTETLVKNVGNVQALKEASEVGRNGLQDVAQDIQKIARESEGLMEINSVMKNIASQTNLLSMNAAIEAAHAGTAGKGFAVVADEIRNLAESSAEQSKTIGTVLKNMKKSIDKISASTGDVLNKFEAIDCSVKVVAEQQENIRCAMEEQGEGSKQILQSASNLSEITHQVKSGSEEMLEGSKEVIQESQNLEKATQEITGGMNEMASGAEQINIAVNHVNEISGKNREGIAALIREVSRFKVA